MYNPPIPLFGGWTENDQPAADTDAVATRAAATGRRHLITEIFADYDDKPTTEGNVTIDFGGTAEVVLGTSNGSVSFNFNPPLVAPEGTAVNATLPAGGAGITGEIFMRGFTF